MQGLMDTEEPQPETTKCDTVLGYGIIVFLSLAFWLGLALVLGFVHP